MVFRQNGREYFRSSTVLKKRHDKHTNCCKCLTDRSARRLREGWGYRERNTGNSHRGKRITDGNENKVYSVQQHRPGVTHCQRFNDVSML